MTKLAFNGKNWFINYDAWDTSNFNLITPFDGNYIFKLDINISGEKCIASRP